MELLKEFVKQKKVFVAAHRGSSGTAPENTIAAFQQALKGGADMIEIDVQISYDNHIICFHDSKLGRTAKGKQRISRLNLKAIKKLDVGTWFDPYYNREKVPTLKEVIELIRDKAYLNIEIKTRPNANNEKRASIIYDAVKKLDYLEYTLFGSFDHKILKYLKEKDPDVNTAAIKVPNDDTLPSELKEKFNVDAYVCSYEEINDEIDKNAKENNIYLAVYTIDNWYEMEKVKQYTIKTIVTDYPATVNPILNKYF